MTVIEETVKNILSKYPEPVSREEMLILFDELIKLKGYSSGSSFKEG